MLVSPHVGKHSSWLINCLTSYFLKSQVSKATCWPKCPHLFQMLKMSSHELISSRKKEMRLLLMNLMDPYAVQTLISQSNCMSGQAAQDGRMWSTSQGGLSLGLWVTFPIFSCLCKGVVCWCCSSSSLRLLINHFMLGRPDAFQPSCFQSLMHSNPHAFQPSCFLTLMFFNPHVF